MVALVTMMVMEPFAVRQSGVSRCPESRGQGMSMRWELFTKQSEIILSPKLPFSLITQLWERKGAHCF